MAEPKMAERLRKIREKPIVDERIPHPYREVIKELKAISGQLEEIKQRLGPPAPPIVVRPPPAPPIPAITLPKEEFRKIYEEALEKYEALRLADDLHVETIDLGKDRTAKAIGEFPKLAGIGLTILKCTGTVDIYINKKDDYHKITLDAIEYPQTFVLDWFKVRTIHVGNVAQTGKQLVIIAWKRTT